MWLSWSKLAEELTNVIQILVRSAVLELLLYNSRTAWPTKKNNDISEFHRQLAFTMLTTCFQDAYIIFPPKLTILRLCTNHAISVWGALPP